MVKALPETTAPNGPPSRKVKVDVVTALAVWSANEFATTLNEYPRRAAPVIGLEHKPNGRA
jgi:hypothetical protein